MWAVVSPDLVTDFLEEAWIYQDDKYKHKSFELGRKMKLKNPSDMHWRGCLASHYARRKATTTREDEAFVLDAG